MSGVDLPTRTLGAENFPPRFFFALRKSAYRRVDNIRANLIAQKKRLKSSRRFSWELRASLQRTGPHSGIVYSKAGFSCGSMVHCKKQNYCLGLPNPMRFLAGPAQVCNRKPPVQGLLALGSSFCGLRAILPRRGFCKARRLPRGRRRRARNPGCRSRLQIRMWHSRRPRGR